MEGIFDSISDNSVACIGTTIEPSREVIPVGEDWNEFPFSLVSPLRAQDNCKFGVETVEAALDRHKINVYIS